MHISLPERDYFPLSGADTGWLSCQILPFPEHSTPSADSQRLLLSSSVMLHCLECWHNFPNHPSWQMQRPHEQTPWPVRTPRLVMSKTSRNLTVVTAWDLFSMKCALWEIERLMGGVPSFPAGWPSPLLLLVK